MRLVTFYVFLSKLYAIREVLTLRNVLRYPLSFFHAKLHNDAVKMIHVRYLAGQTQVRANTDSMRITRGVAHFPGLSKKPPWGFSQQWSR